jgi:hypothetical protein
LKIGPRLAPAAVKPTEGLTMVIALNILAVLALAVLVGVAVRRPDDDPPDEDSR